MTTVRNLTLDEKMRLGAIYDYFYDTFNRYGFIVKAAEGYKVEVYDYPIGASATRKPKLIFSADHIKTVKKLSSTLEVFYKLYAETLGEEY